MLERAPQQPPGPSCDPLAVVQFIWEDQDGLADVTSDPKRRRPRPITDALADIPGAAFFAPVRRRVGSTTSRKTDCIPEANIVWLDYDAEDVYDWIDSNLAPLGLHPSVVIASGGGYWVYLKLARPIPLDEIEAVNRGLVAMAPTRSSDDRRRGDKSPTSAATLARCPQSLNDGGGKYDPPRMARVLSMDTTAVFAPEDLAHIRDRDPRRREASAVPCPPSSERSPLRQLRIRRADLRRYVEEEVRPDWAPSDSEVDISLAKHLYLEGATTGEVEAFFRAVQPLGWRKRNLRQSYLDLTLARAWEGVQQDPSSTLSSRDPSKSTSISSLCTGLPAASTPKPRGSLKAGRIDRFAIPAMAKGQRLTQLYDEVAARFGCSPRAAREAVRQLRRTGILLVDEDPSNRSIKYVFANEYRLNWLTKGRFLSMAAAVHFWPDQYDDQVVESFLAMSHERKRPTTTAEA